MRAFPNASRTAFDCSSCSNKQQRQVVDKSARSDAKGREYSLIAPLSFSLSLQSQHRHRRRRRHRHARALTRSLTRSTSLCLLGLVTAAMYRMMILLASVFPAPLSPAGVVGSFCCSHTVSKGVAARGASRQAGRQAGKQASRQARCRVCCWGCERFARRAVETHQR